MKICSKCGIEKQLTEFGKNAGTKDGLRSNCKACKNATSKKHREANPGLNALVCSAYYYANRDDRLAKEKQSRDMFPEKKRAKDRKYYLANKEKRIAANSKYKKDNPEKVMSMIRARRAKKYKAEGSHTPEDILGIFSSQRGICANCPARLAKTGKNKYHIDHIMPLSKGGTDDKYNLQCLCPSCNMRKNAKDPIVWANENGKLI